MIYLAKFLFVMIAMALTDMCWAYYFMKVEERNAPQAGMWAVLLFLSGAVVTTNYVGDNTLVFAAALGAFIGTYFTVKFKKK
jgi:hypothetical protein